MYKIVDTLKRIDIQSGYACREYAKPKRNELNGPVKDNFKLGDKRRFVISRDVNHPRGETDGFDHTATKRWL